MKLRLFFTLIDDVYKVTMRTEDWSQLDQELMAKYAEPEIDLGGSFTGPPAYTLPNNLVRIMTESPFSQSFDEADYPAEAELMADEWADTITTRLNAAIVALRANTDDYTREEVETI